MTQAPVLETERLRLRPWRKDDFRPYHALLQHPEVHRHFGPEPMGAEECWRRLTAAVGNWQFNGFGTWAAERKDDCKLVGRSLAHAETLAPSNLCPTTKTYAHSKIKAK